MFLTAFPGLSLNVAALMVPKGDSPAPAKSNLIIWFRITIIRRFLVSILNFQFSIFNSFFTFAVRMEESVKHIRIAEFNYELPDERIAKFPLAERDR